LDDDEAEVGDDELPDNRAIGDSQIRGKNQEVALEDMVKRVDETNGDYDFLGYLVKTLVEENVMGSDGGILVFLRGASGQAGRVGKGSAINLFRNIHMPTFTSTRRLKSCDAYWTKLFFHCSFLVLKQEMEISCKPC
jgi:hypothetical protein